MVTTRGLLLTICACFYLLGGQAAVRLPALVTDHMVLQRDQALPIWGWAEAGEHVAIWWQDHRYTATTAAGGKWQVLLPAAAAGGPFTMTIQGSNTLVINDILVGDVWLASGQSNMEMPLRDANAPQPGAYPVVLNAEQEVAQASFPQIRQFTVKKAPAATPQAVVEGHWQVCSPQTAAQFAGVPYFFARGLHLRYHIPIGIISSPWGGTPAEAWISQEALQTLPDYQEKTRSLTGDARTVLAVKDPQNTPTALFNGMIAPLIPYALKGIIWYQGESNVGRAKQYRTLFPALIQDWRRRWGQELPFLFVQLANWQPRELQPSDSDWARLREAQATALALPKTGMAVAIDVGDAHDIHPANKQAVGQRLVLLASNKVYGEQAVVAAGPTLEKVLCKRHAVQLTFTQAGSGLQAKGDTLRGFAVAGADKQFHWATATLHGHKVVLTSPAVPKPVAVRYNWANNPSGNLYNREGLPALPFRTDAWD
ncbi:sialate O-acetylesterase [Hymenobacter sp. BT18]|uniref:sialate O-acetylesterase n=1 Tax=Hymenobacter sp. BT18 TaxID=2835648 RepID=UPI00143EE080|nr:sialate O-acetylesterase [Hymenobacter sp. BT18]QIX60124.1 sialate O-acetylesterase [Hymenobacter sp. BT18]